MDLDPEEWRGMGAFHSNIFPHLRIVDGYLLKGIQGCKQHSLLVYIFPSLLTPFPRFRTHVEKEMQCIKSLNILSLFCEAKVVVTYGYIISVRECTAKKEKIKGSRIL